MDKRLEYVLELTRLVFDANSKGLRLQIDIFGGGGSVSVSDISGLYVLPQEGKKWVLIKVGNASLSDEFTENPAVHVVEDNYMLSELVEVVRNYIENNTK